MKALILAAGYATRLYPLTEHTPKALLEVGGKPIVQHILEKMQELPDLKEIFIITNHRFYDHFRIWLSSYHSQKKITLLNDGTLSNNDRLGAVGDLHFVLKEQEIEEDLLVVAGDNLFGFSLKKFTHFFQQGKKSLVAFYDLKDKEKVKKQYGVGQLEDTKVVHFEEKPAVPKSSLASTACYFFIKEDLLQVEAAIHYGKADNPGDLLKWLTQKSEVHGFVFQEYWFDVGTPESLEAARQYYTSKQSNCGS